MNQAVVGKEGQVTQVLTNGWVNMFIHSLRLNEQVQQRYLTHIEPGRVVRMNLAHPAQETVPQQQPAASEAALIESFPELPHDLDGLVGGLDGDLFLETSHPMPLGEPLLIATCSLQHECQKHTVHIGSCQRRGICIIHMLDVDRCVKGKAWTCSCAQAQPTLS